MKHHCVRAFTLIELLVVIAVISILSAILFPVFAAAREKARQTSCASNEKQLGLAFQQYTQDYDETYPVDSNGNGSEQGWAGQIYPYVKSYGSFACPDDTSNTALSCPANNCNVCSYAMNANLMEQAPGVNPINTYAVVGRLTAPSSTVLLCEVRGARDVILSSGSLENQSPTAYATVYTWGPLNKPNSFSFDAVYATGNVGGNALACIATDSGAAHTQMSNFLAADGHVKLLRPDRVSGGFTPTTSTSIQTGRYAAGAGSMLITSDGNPVTLTWSPL